MIEIDDNYIVDRVLDGFTEEYKILVSKYQKPVFNYAIRNLHDYDAAKDITQKVFIKAYERLSSFNRDFKFFSWIYRIAINETINYLKYSSRNVKIDDYYNLISSSVCEDIEKKEFYSLLEKEIAKLKEKYKTVITLKYFQDLAYSEIAEVLNISENKVRSRLFTARRILYEKLKRHI